MCLVWREIGVQGIEVIQAKNTLVSVRLLVLVYKSMTRFDVINQNA